MSGEPIAVTGMGCRFPGGATDPERYWRMLADGVDAVSEEPPARAALHGDPGRPDDVRYGAFLDEVDRFDAAFFGISAPEAAALDPQQRLLLEIAWEALEDAGVPPDSLRGSATGVFAGLTNSDYLMLSVAAGGYDAYTGTGATHCFGPGRLSYHLGLQGPSLAVDTACSSSLVAVHLAVRSLRGGECSLALAGGANLILTPASTRLVEPLNALSSDGRCRAFDARANGFVRGEGCGMVVLKRESDARADGDRILAVIRGTAVNQDGASSGLTAPNPIAQRDLVRAALDDGGADPGGVTYIETHGTGTPLGDPIEAAALGEALGRGDAPCLLGAVKTNIGHLEAAAGIAGLIKAVLALRHEQIPATLHFTTLNPRVELDGTRLRVAERLEPWPAGDTPRVAGVSSFGMSGTNAHVIIEEAPPAAPPTAQQRPDEAVLVPLSARSPDALAELARAYAEHLRRDDVALHDVAYTAAVRRTHHPHRAAATGGTREELVAALEAAARRRPATPRTTAPRVAFVFGGQGTQWAGMGCGLHAAEPTFADALDACDTALAPHLGYSIADELARPPDDSRLVDTEVAQPALFALQVALAALLRAWGVEPSAVIGHSLGEIAAAHVAGALTLEQAAGLVAARGRIMKRAAGSGGMLAVSLGAHEARRAIDGRATIAAVNDRASVVLSGPRDALTQLAAELRANDVRCRELAGSYAFHSPAVAPLADELERELDGLTPSAASLAMYSTVDGARIDGTAVGARYWAANVREPVRFAQAATEAIAAGVTVFVELNAHHALAGNLSECLLAQGIDGAVVPTLRRHESQRARLLQAAGDLYAHGLPVDFARVHRGGGHVVTLPTYPWQRRPHWLSPAPTPAQTNGDADGRDGWWAGLTALAPDEREERVRAAVREDVAGVLGLASPGEVPTDRELLELGMDSLMAVQVRHELAARTGMSLPSTIVFDHPTVDALTAHLLQTVADPIGTA